LQIARRHFAEFPSVVRAGAIASRRGSIPIAKLLPPMVMVVADGPR
jgi:hypothetical protein